jgi:hypothetical protein
VPGAVLAYWHKERFYRTTNFISSIKRSRGAYSSGIPKKPPPTVSRTKTPVPMIEPIPVIAPVIPPLRPGVVAKNLTGKLTRPNPAVRRGKR